MSAALTTPLMLMVERGPEKGKRYRIVSPMISIGREVQNDIILTDLKVSRFHLSLKLENGYYHVYDLSQKGALKVNGEIVEKATLQINDRIEIGDTVLGFKEVPTERVKPLQPSPAPSVAQVSTEFRKPAAAAQKNDVAFKGILIALVVVMLGFWLFSDSGKKKKPSGLEIGSATEWQESLEEIKNRRAQLEQKRSFSSVQEQENFNTAEEHYVKGYRDFTKGEYKRAITSFETALVANRGHTMARTYLAQAKKRLDYSIDSLLQEGKQHYEKRMFSRCEGALRKARILINDTQDARFIQAAELEQECQLRREGP